MALWSFSRRRMDELGSKKGQELCIKVVYKGHPFLVEGEVESVNPFVSIALDEKSVTILETKEKFKFRGVAKHPFMWKGTGIQVVSEDFQFVDEKEIFEGILYENYWVGDRYNIDEDNTVRSIFGAIYGDKVAREAIPKIEKEQEEEENLKKAWIKLIKKKSRIGQ